MKTRTLSLAIYFSLAVSLPKATAESDPGTLESGARVRVNLRNGSSTIGRLVSLDDSRLRIHAEKESTVTTIERSGVTSVEASLGKRSKGRGARRGALIGGSIGAAITVLGLVGCGDFCDADGGLIAASALANAAIGAGIGAAIGAGNAGTERWQPVPTDGVRVGLIAGPARGLGLRVSIGF